jgi:hypothetical protein
MKLSSWALNEFRVHKEYGKEQAQTPVVTGLGYKQGWMREASHKAWKWSVPHMVPANAEQKQVKLLYAVRSQDAGQS